MTTDQFIFDAIRKLEMYGHENAFEVYWMAKFKYRDSTQRAFFAIPLFNFFFQHFVTSPHIDTFLGQEKLKADKVLGMNDEEKQRYKDNKIKCKKIGLKKLIDSLPQVSWFTT